MMNQIVKKNVNEVERESGQSSGHLTGLLSRPNGPIDPAG